MIQPAPIALPRLATDARYHLKLLGLAVALLLSAQAVTAQHRIHGVVVDASGIGIPGVNVSLRGQNIGTISTDNGRFEIRPVGSGSHVVVCSFIGFRTTQVRVQVPSEDVVRCVLEETVLAGEEVIVTASRRPQLASDVPASLEVISAEYLAARRVESLDVAIRNTPGVQLQGNQVNIRGSSGFAYNVGSRVLLLVDGMALMSPDTDGIPFESFPMDRIEQIEILKGPGSALYGSGALGGVINLISKKSDAQPVTRIRTSVGYYAPFRYNRWTSQWPGSADGSFNYSFSASHARRLSRNASGWVSLSGIVDEGFLEANRSRVVNGYGKLDVRISGSTSLQLLAGFLNRRADNFLFWNGLSDALNPGSLAISRTADATGSSDNLTTTYSFLPQVTSTLRNSAILTTRARFYALLIRPINDDGSPKPLSQGTVGFRFGAESQYSKQLGKGYLTSGATVDANITRSSFFLSESGAETGRQPEAAVYAQYESGVDNRVSAVAGLRADVFWISTIERVGSLSPKLGLSYRIGEQATIRGAWGKGFRVPSIAERFTDDQGFFPVFRNLDLRPETSLSYEVGIRTSKKSWGLSADIAAFWFNLDNLIEPRFVQKQEPGKPRLLGFQFVNLDKGRVAGFETDLKADLSERISGRIGYTFLDSKDRSTGKPLAYRPRHLLVAGTSFAGTLNSGGFDFRFASEPNAIDSDFSRFVPDADVLVNTVVADIHYARKIRGIEVSLIVNNLFDYYYLDRPALLAAPREFVVQMTTVF